MPPKWSAARYTYSPFQRGRRVNANQSKTSVERHKRIGEILVFGINHKSATIDFREHVAFAPEVVVESLRDAVRQMPLEEAALLSTCNRTEIYAAGDVSDEQLLEWLAANRQLPLETLQGCYYCHRDLKALRHLMQVASGLDSLVLGEPQIFGQIKSKELKSISETF